MALIASGLLFAIFAANVFLGATANANFLNDIQEMLMLFAASVFFVAAILRREARAKASDKNESK